MMMLAMVITVAESTCHFTIDSPDPLHGMVRAGGDFKAVTMDPKTATLTRCADLCCQADGCVAFSYNAPWTLTPGWMGCVVGKPCCSLKSTVTALVPNKWQMNITTGVINSRDPGTGKPAGVPEAFDCAVRKLAYDYARQVRPDKASFTAVFDALQLDTCNISRPFESVWRAPPVAPVTAVTTEQLEFFVSAERGNDTESGTIETPFATPKRGVTACRAAKSSSCVVTLRRGTYYLADSPLMIGADDSGLTIRSYAGERAELSGGMPLTGLEWKPANATRRAGTAAVFSAPFHSGNGALQSLRLRGSGRRVTRAR
jgi:hypothetical protein